MTMGERTELLGLARLCANTNTALFDFTENCKNSKALAQMGKALRFLRLFSTKTGYLKKPYAFGKERKLTTAQIFCTQEYLQKDLMKFRLAVEELSELLATKPARLTAKMGRTMRCVHFFLGLLFKCLWKIEYVP